MDRTRNARKLAGSQPHNNRRNGEITHGYPELLVSSEAVQIAHYGVPTK